MRCASSTVRPQPGITPTRACVSAKRARSERDEEVAVERDLEAAGHRDAVDRADQRLGVRRERAAERRRGRSPTSAKPSPCCTSPEPNSFRSTPAENAGSAPVRIITSTSSSASHARDRGRQRRAHVAVQRVALLGPVERDDRDPIGDVDENDVAQRHVAPEVERDLDRAGVVLGGERGERVAPVVERERVREHAGEVDRGPSTRGRGSARCRACARLRPPRTRTRSSRPSRSP